VVCVARAIAIAGAPSIKEQEPSASTEFLMETHPAACLLRNAESVGSQSPGLHVLVLPRGTREKHFLFGPLAPAQGTGD
jgi:hypothetical protein